MGLECLPSSQTRYYAVCLEFSVTIIRKRWQVTVILLLTQWRPADIHDQV